MLQLFKYGIANFDRILTVSVKNVLTFYILAAYYNKIITREMKLLYIYIL